MKFALISETLEIEQNGQIFGITSIVFSKFAKNVKISKVSKIFRIFKKFQKGQKVFKKVKISEIFRKFQRVIFALITDIAKLMSNMTIKFG